VRRFRPNLIPPLEHGERAIYWLVAVLLMLGAVVYLGFTVTEVFATYRAGDFTQGTIELLNGSLLTLMLAQVVYTTLNFLETGYIQIEPVLVVGIIAAVRRILVIAALLSTHAEEGPELFSRAMTELGYMGAITLALAVAVFLIRYRKKEAT